MTKKKEAKSSSLSKSGTEDNDQKHISQPKIGEMFKKMNQKKEEEEKSDNHCTETEVKGSPINTKRKFESDETDAEVKKVKKSTETVKNGLNSKQQSLPEKCTYCRQLVNSSNLKCCNNYPTNSMEEFDMLLDSRLSVHSDGDYDSAEIERPQHKVTCFSIYDKSTHLCSIDQGLIERDVMLYFSGYVKPIYAEDPSPEGGIPVSNIGPIVEWWVSGYDGGSKALIGIGTAYAEYLFMHPSEEYGSFIDAIQEKIYLSKAVIELLTDDEQSTYEDLLNALETTVPPLGVASFGEESLFRHAQFVVDQIQSFDSAANEDDFILITSPCIRDLIKLSGVTLGGSGRAQRKIPRPRIQKVKKPVHSLATTTPLVRSIFENFFVGQLEKDSKQTAPRRKRCGVCESCQLADCGECNHCRDMVKFGGSGRSKQACVKRRCPNMAVQEAEDNDILIDKYDDAIDEDKVNDGIHTKRLALSKKQAKIEWVGQPVRESKVKTFYNSAVINDEKISCGDFVFVTPSKPSIPMYIAKIQSLFETSSGKKMFHSLWFDRGSETVLGETSDPHELFGTYDCEDREMNTIKCLCSVKFVPPPCNWSELGGTDESLEDIPKLEDEKDFYYRKWYVSEACRFEDPPPSHDVSPLDTDTYCLGCQKADEERTEPEYLELGEKSESGNREYHLSVRWLGQTFKVGDCVFINPDVLPSRPVERSQSAQAQKEVDETTYPESYRKSDYIKGSNIDVPPPFVIGYIKEMYKQKSSSKVIVKRFYRPEDTELYQSPKNSKMDLNLLFYSDDELNVELEQIEGKCYVVYGYNLTVSPKEFSDQGPYRFYFNESYDKKANTLEEPSSEARKIGRIGKGGAIKGKKKTSVVTSVEELYPTLSKKLRSLDVFAGCGGLSQGFHAAGVSETLWAIEKEESAAQAFRLNFPGCAVFTEDCNLLLRMVMDGEEGGSYRGQRLPRKGEVDLLTGGPPCQGFSGMNRFNSREYSCFKNSLAVSFLGYCDFYRPRFFLLENVRNFLSFKRSMVLKLTLRCLLRMGYQCTAAVLQAGSYGVPQTRRRAIILAAAPGEKLPQYPEPLHVFSSRNSQLSYMVDDKKFQPNIRWRTSAPHRMVTVRDALSDLPEIRNGSRTEEMAYSGEGLSHFQRKLRGCEQVLHDHVCKEMSALVEARMRHIPALPGADWRDLPNIAERLSDGTYAALLEYTHDDRKNGRSRNGALRGVCACAEGQPCDPADRQFNTLIPWCLPHTGNRHNHWAGLYGRLEWEGFFSTTVTNPEPMGKQGRVLHPEQHRVVSVRECARSQGFPDHYRFFGSLLDRHRQVGNAVPPPLAEALALEIKKCVAQKEATESAKTE